VYQYPFQNPGSPIDERVKKLLGVMALDENLNAVSTCESGEIQLRVGSSLEDIRLMSTLALGK